MPDASTPDPEVETPATSVTSASGGVNLDAQHDVNIAGDVVGGDKVTQNTWTTIRPFIMSPWAWIGGTVLLAVSLIIAAGLFNLRSIQTLIPTPTSSPTPAPSPTAVPSPTPTAFPAARASESLIIVADDAEYMGTRGYYDIKRFTNGYSDENVYFNNPCDFMQHEQDPARLEQLRRLNIRLISYGDLEL